MFFLSGECLTKEPGLHHKLEPPAGTYIFTVTDSAYCYFTDTVVLSYPAAISFGDSIISQKKSGKLVLVTSHVLSELDDLVTQVIYMQDGLLQFHKTIENLRLDTGEEKLSKAIASVMLKSRP